eukprot:9825691-Alexandrium_andersonii.AAC.1
MREHRLRPGPAGAPEQPSQRSLGGVPRDLPGDDTSIPPARPSLSATQKCQPGQWGGQRDELPRQKIDSQG